MKKAVSGILVLATVAISPSVFAVQAVNDPTTNVTLQAIQSQLNQTNALLSSLVADSKVTSSEQAGKSCIYEGKLYGQGARLKTEPEQTCSQENGWPVWKTHSTFGMGK
ncbi:TPA: hypothetical protein ACHSMM_004478 [Yersinia enterocolitica]